MLLVLLAYVALGTYLLLRLPTTDSERSYLGLDRAEMEQRYRREFGLAHMPERMPFRLPAEYWLYAWTRSLRVGRLAALAVSTCALWLTILYAAHLAGPIAGLLAGCVILSSPYTVGVLTSASYVAPVSLLWVGGLYAINTGHPLVALTCGIALALLRASAWGMALALLVHLPWYYSVPTVYLTGTYLWLWRPQVVQAQGWALWLRGENAPMYNWYNDGWHFALRTCAKRYEAWGAWGLAALVLGNYSTPVAWLLGISLVPFALTHYPRTWVRPKWVVGYMPEWAMPVAVALAVTLTR